MIWIPLLTTLLAPQAGTNVSRQTPEEAFRAAEALYEDQRYEEAAAAYEAMVAQGIEDGAVYYNLGNAYFKAGEIGRAILSYERARELLPGDEDVRANLAFANELIADPVEPAPLPLVVGWAVDLYQRTRPATLARLLSAVFLLGGVLVTVWLSERWPGAQSVVLTLVAILAGIALVSGVSLAAKLRSEGGRVEAIVLSENAYVRSGPGDANPRLAEVHEGIKVRVLSEREGWLQVSLANGLTGWIEQGELERIRAGMHEDGNPRAE